MKNVNGTTQLAEKDILEQPPIRPGEVLMRPGLSIWKGLVYEEYLPALRSWSQRSRIYREMIDDATIGALLEAIRTPLLSADFTVMPAGDTDEDKKAAKHLETNLFHMTDMPWREHVEEMLDFLAYGFALSEIVFHKKGNEVRLHTLMPVGQETVHDWGPKLDRLGNPTIVRQRGPTDGKMRQSPLYKMLHFTFRSRKRNPFGMSLLRSLYRPWYFKKNLEVVEAIGAERDVGNMPIAEVGDITLSKEQRDDLEKGLSAFRLDEASFMITPPNVKIAAYTGGSKVYDVRTIIRDWQTIIRQRFFATFIALGTEQVGTQALAREQTTFFSSVLKSIQTRMLEVWERQLIPHIFRFSKFSVDELPALKWAAPGKENEQLLTQAIASAVGAGVIYPDLDLENRVRVLVGVRALGEEEYEKRKIEREQEAQEKQQMDIEAQQQAQGLPPGSPGNADANAKQRDSSKSQPPKSKRQGGTNRPPIGKGKGKNN